MYIQQSALDQTVRIGGPSYWAGESVQDAQDQSHSASIIVGLARPLLPLIRGRRDGMSTSRRLPSRSVAHVHGDPGWRSEDCDWRLTWAMQRLGPKRLRRRRFQPVSLGWDISYIVVVTQPNVRLWCSASGMSATAIAPVSSSSLCNVWDVWGGLFSALSPPPASACRRTYSLGQSVANGDRRACYSVYSNMHSGKWEDLCTLCPKVLLLPRVCPRIAIADLTYGKPDSLPLHSSPAQRTSRAPVPIICEAGY
jgi:hypothetical protein